MTHCLLGQAMLLLLCPTQNLATSMVVEKSWDKDFWVENPFLNLFSHKTGNKYHESLPKLFINLKIL